MEQIIYEVTSELGIKALKLAINPDHHHLFASPYPTMDEAQADKPSLPVLAVESVKRVNGNKGGRFAGCPSFVA